MKASSRNIVRSCTVKSTGPVVAGCATVTGRLRLMAPSVDRGRPVGAPGGERAQVLEGAVAELAQGGKLLAGAGSGVGVGRADLNPA